MIRVLLFGRLGDMLNESELQLDWQEELSDLRQVAAELAKGSRELARELDNPQTLISVNQTLVHWDYHIADGDEIAFLPPVTGG